MMASVLGPLSDPLPLSDLASNAILTPRFNSASQGAERFASVDELASRRLSAVNSAPLLAEDRDAGGAQLSPQPAAEREGSPGRAVIHRLHQGLGIVFPASLACRYWRRLRSSGRCRRCIFHHLRWNVGCCRQTRLFSWQ